MGRWVEAAAALHRTRPPAPPRTPPLPAQGALLLFLPLYWGVAYERGGSLGGFEAFAALLLFTGVVASAGNLIHLLLEPAGAVLCCGLWLAFNCLFAGVLVKVGGGCGGWRGGPPGGVHVQAPHGWLTWQADGADCWLLAAGRGWRRGVRAGPSCSGCSGKRLQVGAAAQPRARRAAPSLPPSAPAASGERPLGDLAALVSLWLPHRAYAWTGRGAQEPRSSLLTGALPAAPAASRAGRPARPRTPSRRARRPAPPRSACLQGRLRQPVLPHHQRLGAGGFRWHRHQLRRQGRHPGWCGGGGAGRGAGTRRAAQPGCAALGCRPHRPARAALRLPPGRAPPLPR